VWTGDARDTRPNPEVGSPNGVLCEIFLFDRLVGRGQQHFRDGGPSGIPSIKLSIGGVVKDSIMVPNV
jgi:hypothetical protein